MAEKLVLIDGNGILHRAFHALPKLTAEDGKLTNAVYGFFSMFIKLVNDLKPDYLAVCFDRAKPTFRQQLYVGYQANRPKMDNELVPQIEMVHNALDSSKIKIFELDGYEADDLIGTITKKAVEGKDVLEIIVVSSDRDLLQLVNSHVRILAPVIGITKMILFDQKSVEEKYGLKPDQIIDYKALVGDPSDNYPGVSGIGPKTAEKLLKEYHSFENLYKNLDKLPQELGKKLAQDIEQASLAKNLATIVLDAPISFDVEDCSLRHFNQVNLRHFFEDLDFKSLIARVDKMSKVEVTEKKEEDKKQLELI
jgi:DNA polymerase-1